MNRKITCAITDDEPIARKGLQDYVSQIGYLSLEGVFDSAVGLNTFLSGHPIDLLFLDIEMPYLSGIELVQSLVRPPKVVFTTAYERYAVKGFELEIADYLLKPISFDRFLKAVNKVQALLEKEGAPEEAALFVKTDTKYERLLLEDIVYLEAMENYVAIHTGKGRILTHGTLRALLDKLPADRFLQVHKSFVVNTRKITHVEGNTLGVGPASIPIGRTLKDSVMEAVLRNRLL